MSFTYHAEYNLGRRGGRVRREHSGLAAVIAISFDLALGLAFGVVGLAWRVACFGFAAAVKVVAEVVRSLAAAARFLGTLAWDLAAGLVRLTAAGVEGLLGFLSGVVDRLSAPRAHLKPAAPEFRDL